MTDPNLPPGVTSRDLARYLDGPAKLHCIGCWLLFPTEQLDEDQTCAECRREAHRTAQNAEWSSREAWLESLAETCQADDHPCAGCQQGGVCDGTKREKR